MKISEVKAVKIVRPNLQQKLRKFNTLEKKKKQSLILWKKCEFNIVKKNASLLLWKKKNAKMIKKEKKVMFNTVENREATIVYTVRVRYCGKSTSEVLQKKLNWNTVKMSEFKTVEKTLV